MPSAFGIDNCMHAAVSWSQAQDLVHQKPSDLAPTKATYCYALLDRISSAVVLSRRYVSRQEMLTSSQVRQLPGLFGGVCLGQSLCMWPPPKKYACKCGTCRNTCTTCIA